MDIMLAITFGLLLLLFLGLCFGRALLPVYGGWIVLPTQGDGAELEQKIYGLLWLQGLGLLRCPICILNQGLNETGLILSKKIVDKWPEITLWQQWGQPWIDDTPF